MRRGSVFVSFGGQISMSLDSQLMVAQCGEKADEGLGYLLAYDGEITIFVLSVMWKAIQSSPEPSEFPRRNVPRDSDTL